MDGLKVLEEKVALLVQLVKDLKKENVRLEKHANDLEKKLSQFEKNAKQGSKELDQERQEAKVALDSLIASIDSLVSKENQG